MRRCIDENLGLTPHEERSVMLKAACRWIDRWESAAVLCGVVIGATAAIVAGAVLFDNVARPVALAYLITIMVLCVPAYLLIGRMLLRPSVCAELRARGHAVCARCGYRLASFDAACPECGNAHEKAGP